MYPIAWIHRYDLKQLKTIKLGFYRGELLYSDHEVVILLRWSISRNTPVLWGWYFIDLLIIDSGVGFYCSDLPAFDSGAKISLGWSSLFILWRCEIYIVGDKIEEFQWSNLHTSIFVLVVSILSSVSTRGWALWSWSYEGGGGPRGGYQSRLKFGKITLHA